MICNAIKLNYLIKNKIIILLQKIFFKKLVIKNINKILIFRTGEIGDNICALPAINMIKDNFPNSKIDMLVVIGDKKIVSFETFLKDGIVDEYIDYNNLGKRELLKVIKSHEYDLVIQLPQNMATFYQQLRDMLFFKLCKIHYGFGWKINSDLFLKKYQDNCVNKSSKNEVDRLIELLVDNGLTQYDKQYPLNIKQKDIEIVRSQIITHKLEDTSKNIALVIGAKIYPKEWDIKNFETVANYFINLGYKILLIGGKEDKEKAQYIVSKYEKDIYDFCGEFTPIQSILMFKYAKLTLTNDTGPMHMSVSVGTPVVALFSSWSYDKNWYPVSDDSIIIRKELECSICYNRSCSNNICMQNITTNEVIEAMNKILERENGN